MNIIVRPSGSGSCYCRPDTTWEREGKDFYCPDNVTVIEWTPIVFARISKAGKCIGNKFASRYYDSYGFGALLYTGSGEIAFTSCTDHTSLLPFPLYNPVVLENEENTFEIRRNGDDLYVIKGNGENLKNLMEESICMASAQTTLRIGDIVAAELEPKTGLTARNAVQTTLSARYCDNELFDIRIIF